MMGLLGPSPADEKANTWNSYSVYLPSPMTFIERVELLSMVTTRSGSTTELFLLYSNLNPVIEPTSQDADGGSFHAARTPVEVSGTTTKLPGDWFGTKIQQLFH